MIPNRHEAQTALSPSAVVTKHLQEREREWTELANRVKPLQLLDLPLDVLQAVIKEVTHTNDLTALALTHSVLHTLVVPNIYSRFDIVWPDAGPTVESRIGVDALTYGLATLVMAQDVFGEAVYQYSNSTCPICRSPNFCQHKIVPVRLRKVRRGNHFARYTRKFSLGNGPEDWVKEYLITKESGKMLGTLVALAIGRMRNLESFTWDMPTGVLRDVWLALASLDGRDDGQECRLERVWVRWHDNQDALISPPLPGIPSVVPDLPQLISGPGAPSFQIPPYPRVEFPTFSVLSPLKSLTVLDIDELSYVEEMSVLIERSLARLQELRVSLAYHTQNRPWARPREDRTLVPPPITSSGEQVSRRGGLLGILVSRFCTAFSDSVIESTGVTAATHEMEAATPAPGFMKLENDAKVVELISEPTGHDMEQLSSLLSAQNLDPILSPGTVTNVHPSAHGNTLYSKNPVQPDQKLQTVYEYFKENEKKLRLDVLELERIYLSVPVLSRAFDWSRLRTLTIISCRDHEQLWKALRKRFTPPMHSRSSSLSKSLNSDQTDAHRQSFSRSSSLPVLETEYQLRITRLHTDMVSTALLAFLKDTLAPDTLEYLFLQQSPAYKSTVTVDQIYKHAVRRHRSSLKKLLLDSDIRAADGSPDGNTNWKRWAVTRDLITCITSGRMQLRELSMSIDYKDWHYFLQRLPHASTLRALHISHIADYVHQRIDAREAALQVLDIVALRPELQLCYLGIQGKCFEILEFPSNCKPSSMPHDPTDIIPHAHLDDDDISDDHDDLENDGNDNGSDDLNLMTDQEDADETDDEGQQGQKKVALRLREILFYDDKISIFKARHGKL